MEAVLFLAATVLLLASIAVWTVRVLRQWSGWWRCASVLPAAVLTAAVAVTVLGYRSEPAGDSFWWFWSFVLVVVASVIAYILNEIHRAKTARHGIPTAPPNVR